MAEAGDAASSRDWIKTLLYNEDNFLTEIDGPD
jgi:hypothetical protein